MEFNSKKNLIRHRQELTISKHEITIGENSYPISNLKRDNKRNWVFLSLLILSVLTLIYYYFSIIDRINHPGWDSLFGWRRGAYIVSFDRYISLNAPLGSLLPISIIAGIVVLSRKLLQFRFTVDNKKITIQTGFIRNYYKLLKFIKGKGDKEISVDGFITEQKTGEEIVTLRDTKSQLIYVIFMAGLSAYYLILGIICLAIQPFNSDGFDSNRGFVIATWIFVLIYCGIYLALHVNHLRSWKVINKDKSLTYYQKSMIVFVISVFTVLVIQLPLFFMWENLITNN